MVRQSICVRGVVQGVGFRPFVYNLASSLELAGSVKNLSGSVWIEVEGHPRAIEQFCCQLRSHAPRLAQIDSLERRPLPARGGAGFHIEPSEAKADDRVFVSPDLATCDACLAELFSPTDRRYRYPFVNCTDCGPRLTIVEGTPYDRQRTTMAEFGMCPACLAEFNDPTNRRFHAQASACPACGPQLFAWSLAGEPLPVDEPLDVFVQVIIEGGIGAMKGLGGFHLVCDARSEQAVATLRARKHRDQKPLAVMVPNLAAARRWCEVEPPEQSLLESPQRPIVLLRRRRDAIGDAIAESVAPGNPNLGLMLPYTPLHHLLLDEVAGAPLVMTSGNRADEPIARTTDEALEHLRGIADIVLTHNRAIHVRCDDSVTRVVAGCESPIRRSRGYAPLPITLRDAFARPLLAVGGQYKGAFAVGCDRQAFLSHHLGDLDQLAAYRAFENEIGLYEQLFNVRPRAIVCDRHPDYASTSYATGRAAREEIELIATQHHHAHMASCMAEHGLDEPVIGVVFDGTGYGLDGAVWGGEFLVGDYRKWSRYSHLRYVRLPGGAKAIEQPWRMAVAHLIDAGCTPDIVAPKASGTATPTELRAVEQMIARGFNSPQTSSAGRLFDAVASIGGAISRVTYEGQAAIEWEWLATDVPEQGVYPFELQEAVDTRPLIRAIVDDLQRGTSRRVISRRFHSTLVALVAAVCQRIRAQTGLDAVVLSGGVFQNAILLQESCEKLTLEGFRVYRHRLVPSNDGGLCLGQLAIAAAQDAAD